MAKILVGPNGRNLALAAVFFLAWPVQAQQHGGQETKKTYDANLKLFRDYLNGAGIPDPVKDKAILVNIAEYHVYRVTWPTLEKEEWKKGMAWVLDDFKNLMENAATKDGKNKEFMAALAPHLITCFQKVLEQAKDFKTRYTAVTNAALMLPMFAKCRQDAAHDYLIELAKADKDGQPVTHPFIRMCAIKGLGEITAQGGPWASAKKPLSAAELSARDLNRLEVIVQFICQPYPPQGEGPEFADAFAYVRREGVKACAQFQVPAYEVKNGNVAGPVAFYLLSVANGTRIRPNQVGPAYALSEKLEAAIGVCNLQSARVKEYNAELAAFVVANVLAEFANGYKEDFPFVSAPKTDLPKMPLLPWPAYAKNLELGLEKMVKESPAVAKKLADAKGGIPSSVRDVLKAIQLRRTIEQLPSLDALAAVLRPAAAEVFIGNKQYTLQLQAKGLPGPE